MITYTLATLPTLPSVVTYFFASLDCLYANSCALCVVHLVLGSYCADITKWISISVYGIVKCNITLQKSRCMTLYEYIWNLETGVKCTLVEANTHCDDMKLCPCSVVQYSTDWVWRWSLRAGWWLWRGCERCYCSGRPGWPWWSSSGYQRPPASPPASDPLLRAAWDWRPGHPPPHPSVCPWGTIG